MDILNTDNITNVSVRKFLEDKLFPNLRMGLQELVDLIHDNGELEKYWSEVEKVMWLVICFRKMKRLGKQLGGWRRRGGSWRWGLIMRSQMVLQMDPWICKFMCQN